ncbi:MAG: hypothetical protein QOJ51_4781 [Acidobacteriaceae bacterium]|nr:hypothetical protein [Acidobacteriaceae bacterium]
MARTDARFICLSTTSPSRLLVACWLRASLRGRTALNREILMRRCVITFFGACLSLFLCLPLHGQTSSGRTSIHPQTADDDDPRDILEVGVATSWNTTGGAATFAPNLAVETTPIENWLELEGGSLALLHSELYRVGYGSALQEAVDIIPESGVHAWRRA